MSKTNDKKRKRVSPAVVLGRIGGEKTTPAKIEAARRNGRLGGRPSLIDKLQHELTRIGYDGTVSWTQNAHTSKSDVRLKFKVFDIATHITRPYSLVLEIVQRLPDGTDGVNNGALSRHLTEHPYGFGEVE